MHVLVLRRHHVIAKLINSYSENTYFLFGDVKLGICPFEFMACLIVSVAFGNKLMLD